MNKEEEKAWRMLGLARRAGATTMGVALICEALRYGKKDAPRVVLEAKDTSANTHKRLADRCAFYGVPHYVLSLTGEELAQKLGKTGALAAVGVSDVGMANAVCAAMQAADAATE